jgi:PIN domain nuclease of toxin-antitoxin system
VKVLLDTNALLWLLTQDEGASKLGKDARRLIHSGDAVFVSAISVLEIRMKSMLGKLDANSDLLRDISDSGLKFLVFSVEAADRVSEFPSLVRHDPFDRMLLAQALCDEMLLITADKVLLDLKLGYVIDATK